MLQPPTNTNPLLPLSPADMSADTSGYPTTNGAPAHQAFAPAAGLSTWARAPLALVLANLRYWRTVAPLVHAELACWEQAARAIPDPHLHELARAKLSDERFNVDLAATLATLAPRAQRARAVVAIVALQVLYDYVDVLTEQPAAGPVGSRSDARALLAALTDAVTLANDADLPSGADHPRDYFHDRPDDGGYLQALVEGVRTALAPLPAAAAIAPIARAAAARCAEAQALNHDASRSGLAQLRRAATAQGSGTGLGWQEYLAGATASVLAVHALIAAAADPTTTPEDAADLDRLYLSIGALTMLDSLVDRDEDIAAGQLGYVQYYDDPHLLASRLALLARDTVARARALPNGAHHIVTLVGIVAYYASAPTANTEFARPLIAPVRRELRPLITPTLALFRAWRLAKRARAGRHPGVRHA